MSIPACEYLTERERACLRLVTPGFQEKLLADQLGISHHTVKVHLRAARAKLHVSSSIAAADLLAHHEGRTPPTGITTVSGMGAARSIQDHNDTPFPMPTSSSETVVREDSGSAFVPSYDDPDAAPHKPRGPDYAFTTLQRLALVATAILFLALAIVAAPAIYSSFQQVANRISPAEP